MKRVIVLTAAVIIGIAGLIAAQYESQREEAVEADAAISTPAEENTQTETKTETEEKSVPGLIFSHTDTFYNQMIKVEITSEDPDFDGQIYFTTDGSPPNEESKLYTVPISITSGPRVKAQTIKAIAYSNGESSEIITKSYLVSSKIFERFSPDTYVFILSADPFDLFDYNEGIAVEGIIREDYIRESRDRNPDPPRPANFNVRSRHIDRPFDPERPFFVEVYDYQGNQLIHQLAGGKIHGGWSRAHDQKSWRLIARNQYSDGKFRFPFFDDAVNFNGQIISRFDRLVLRNGGNDRWEANMRDELTLKLAANAGFPDFQSAVPAAVFLNSSYYGFAWLKEAFCNGYLEQMYGGRKDNYKIIQKGEWSNIRDDMNYTDDERQAYADWQDVMSLAWTAVEHGGSVTVAPARRTAEYKWENIAWRGTVGEDNRMPIHSDVAYIDGDGSPSQGRLLRFGNINLGNVVPQEATITFYTNPPADGNRRLNVWTDLSGRGADKITFITNGGTQRVNQELIMQSAQVEGAAITVTIPASLLHDASTGKYATEIYVVPSLAMTSDPFGREDFRRNTTDIITSATLRVTYNSDSSAAEEVVPDIPEHSFANDAVFEKFCSLVDIDNLMLYYAIQIFVDNNDWPGNNMRMYKYCADEDEVITNPHNDGKWRFMLYDAEFAWGLYGRSVNQDTLRVVLGQQWGMGGTSYILKALLQREDMREKFANTMCDLIDGAFSVESALKVIDELDAISTPELNQAVIGNRLWSNFSGHRDVVRDFARARPRNVLNFTRRGLGLDRDQEMYEVSMTGQSGADAWMNTRRITGNADSPETITTNYFSCYAVPIKADPYSGYEFVRWEINGVSYHDAEMKINSSMADRNGKISITLHTEKMIDGMPLYIRELCTANGADWVELYNPNSVAISTRDYFLSDDGNNLGKWKIPTVSIPPNNGVIIVMRNNRSPDSLFKMQTNFSLSAGETLFLTDRDGNILGAVDIPEVERGEILRRTPDGNYIIEGVG